MAEWRLAGALAVALLAAGPARAEDRPIVAELFTSEGCSSCPPAEAVLAELARTRPDVLALGFHVTYWDRLGWADPYALPAATARQQHYAAGFGLDSVYTPQLVVDGRQEMVGSDRSAVLAALRTAARQAGPPVALLLTPTDAGLRVSVAAGAGQGMLVLIGFDPLHRTAVARGENAGRVLTEVNAVRDIRPLGHWDGRAWQRVVPPPAGERVAAILQAADGQVLGAALLR